MKPPKRRKPSVRRERLPELPGNLSPRLRDVFVWPPMRRAFLRADAVWAVDEGRRVLFHGRRAVERANAANTVPEITMLVPINLDNPDDIKALVWACVNWKGSCCHLDTDVVHPALN